MEVTLVSEEEDIVDLLVINDHQQVNARAEKKRNILSDSCCHRESGHLGR